ncbi:GxxExxY protein [Prevotella histicola]
MGLSEVVYKDALTYKPTKNGLKLESEVDVPILHNNVIMEHNLELNILVER